MKPFVAISGTSRPGNYTSRALAVVVARLRESGATVEVFDARNLQLGFPGAPATDDGARLKAAVEGAEGVVIATPEYHGSFSAMTKLVIENLGFPSALAKKPVALVGVAGGRIGAIKSLEHLRNVCAHTGAVVMPGAVSVAGVRQAFDDDGAVQDAGVESALNELADGLLGFVRDYVCPRHVLEEMTRGADSAWTTTV